MMKWLKLGHIFRQEGFDGWRKSSALTPTPILINDDILRVYAGFRDEEGISRIGYVDLDANNPKKVIKVSRSPVLDHGRDGCFDDNGVILGDILNVDGILRMYYVGFQLVKKAKFLAFSGLAISTDNGETFIRYSDAPILDRNNNASTIRAIHTVMYDEGLWKIWYASGDSWQIINGVPYPKYNIWYADSNDGLTMFTNHKLCVDVLENEYRIGRPSVYKYKDLYYMFYTKGSISGKDYFPGVAISSDGIKWVRKDKEFGLQLSESGFDSIHLCYPRLINVKEKTYCVYNGNNMGAEGFGMAELLQW